MRILAVLMAVIVVPVIGSALVGGASTQESYGGLPPGEGRETVYAVCSGCHSIRLVTQQGMSRKRWDKALAWMTSEQGMPELDAATRETVLDYLAAHLGEARPREGLSPYNRVQPLQRIE